VFDQTTFKNRRCTLVLVEIAIYFQQQNMLGLNRKEQQEPRIYYSAFLLSDICSVSVFQSVLLSSSSLSACLSSDIFRSVELFFATITSELVAIKVTIHVNF
jgi:hypothetical protein